MKLLLVCCIREEFCVILVIRRAIRNPQHGNNGVNKYDKINHLLKMLNLDLFNCGVGDIVYVFAYLFQGSAGCILAVTLYVH